jgi:hypothetical protein
MTLTIRSLALITGCALAAACSEGESKAPAPRPRIDTPAPEAPKPIDVPPVALSAVSPARPGSIADAPSAGEPKQGELAPTGEVAEVAPAAVEHDEYDRPLDPAEVKIDRFVLARGVEQREPVGESDVFGSDTKQIFAFVQLANEAGLPYAFRVHFEPLAGPATPYGVELTVPTAPRWRTWSWTRIERAPGRYKAVLRTLDGQDIAERTFTITAPTELDDTNASSKRDDTNASSLLDDTTASSKLDDGAHK